MRKAILFLLLTPAFCSAQDVQSFIDVGTPPSGLFHGGEIDTVQTNNGNLHIEIPLWTVKGRGPVAVGAIFVLDTKEWTAKFTTNKQTGLVTATVGTEVNGTFGGIVSGLTRFITSSTHNAGTTSCWSTTGWQSDYVIREPNGTKHHLVPDPGNGCPPVQHWNIYYADDGSGFAYSSTSGMLRKNGIGVGMDTNGNQIVYGQDTLGRTLTDGSLTYYDSSGNVQTIQITTTLVPVSTHICQFLDGYDTCNEQTGSRSEVSQIKLANGMIYQINYVQNDEGEPSSITLPSGAQISWTYNVGDQGGATVATRKVTADGQANTWNYSYTATTCFSVISCPVQSIIDPLGNETDLTYEQDLSFIGPSQNTMNVATLLFVAQKQVKDKSSGTLVLEKTEKTDYSKSAGPNLPIRVTTTWNATNQVRKVETDNDYFTNSNVSGFTFSAGNPIAEREYDWGTGAPGSLLRDTVFNYLHLTNSAYLNANILDRTTSKSIYDSTSNTCKGLAQACSQTTYSYDSTAITSTSSTPAPNHDYTGHGYTFTVRGNLTQTSRWLNTNGTWLSTTNIYDDLGNLRSATDPNGNTTSLSYVDNFTDGSNRNAQAFVTQVTRPVVNGVNHIEKKQYFWYTSLVAASCGQNFSAACVNTASPPQPDFTRLTYDKMFRPLTITRGDSGTTSVTYNDSSLPLSATAVASITSSLNKTTTGIFDDLFRVKQTQLAAPAPEGTIYTDTTYDALGRKSTMTNPHYSSSLSTDGTTSIQYDALNRILKTTQPDGSVVTATYSGSCATMTDEAGKARKSCSDGLGRLSQVIEDPAGVGYETDYTYDTLDNLLTVNQKGGSTNSALWRTRTFTYDSVSRLLTANNPESGSISYTYDGDSNLQTKTAPAPNQNGTMTVTTTYSYDALNRLTNKSYSDGTSNAGFTYDISTKYGIQFMNPVGRMVLAERPCSTVSFSYDQMGRIVSNLQNTYLSCTGGAEVATLNYAYDLAGDMTSNSNGAVTFTQTFDSAARLSAITSSWVDSQHPATLYSVDSSVGYYPVGAVRKATFGNGLTETMAINSRLQPCRIEVNSTSSYFSSCSDATPSGNSLDFTYGYNFGNSDNGNVASWSAVGSQTFSRSYSYDSLNRIATLADTASSQACKGLSWTVDPWGNLTDQTVTSGTCYTFHSSVGTNNRLGSPYQYDAAGNMTNDGTHSYTFDAENRIISVDGGNTASYIYDALDRRSIKLPPSGVWTQYFYDLNNNVVSEFGEGCGPTCLARAYVYAGGKHIAEYWAGTTYFVHGDHLGSTRLLTAMDKSTYDSMDFLPFGTESAGDTGATHKFTGKERDAESGLDNFGARYYGSAFDRFSTADSFTTKLLANPQDLDLYTYALNNPLRYFDPDGRDWKESLMRLVGSVTVKAGVGLGGGGRVESHGSGVNVRAELKGSLELNTERGVTGKVTTEVGAEVSVSGKKYGPSVTGTNASVTVHPDGSVDAQTNTKTDITLNGKSTSSGDVSSGGSSNGEFTVFAVETTVLVPIGDGVVPVTESGELNVNLKEATDAAQDLKKDLADLFKDPGPPPPPKPPALPNCTHQPNGGCVPNKQANTAPPQPH